MTDDAGRCSCSSRVERSGPARRMESLLAHLARKERDRLRVRASTSTPAPELAEQFKVDIVPTLVLVKDKRAVARLEGRASAPRSRRCSSRISHTRRQLAGLKTDLRVRTRRCDGHCVTTGGRSEARNRVVRAGGSDRAARGRLVRRRWGGGGSNNISAQARS